MIGVGSRVFYVGKNRNDWLGIPAEVTHLTDKRRYAELKFDRDWTAYGVTNNCGRSVPVEDLKEITVINPKRPVQTTENPPRECRTIGLLERVEGTVTMLIAVPWNSYDGMPMRAPQEVEIDLSGKVINGTHGTGLTFMNVPKVESGFYPVDKMGLPTGRGLTVLAIAMSDYPGVNQFMEIVRVDGAPTEAKYHAR